MKKFLVAFLLIFFTAVHAGASGIPTVDILGNVLNATDLIQTIMQTLKQAKQIANQVQQIRNQIAQLEQMEKEFESMSGNYNMGELINGPAQHDMRRYLPGKWASMQTLSVDNGVPPSVRDKLRIAINLARRARSKGEQYRTEDIFLSKDQKSAKIYEGEGRSIYSTMGATQATFDQTGKRIGELENITEEIDKAEDLKAAMDLGNRIDSENAMLMNELIRQLSIMNIQQTEQRGYRHNQTGADFEKTDMTLPDLTRQ